MPRVPRDDEGANASERDPGHHVGHGFAESEDDRRAWWYVREEPERPAVEHDRQQREHDRRPPQPGIPLAPCRSYHGYQVWHRARGRGSRPPDNPAPFARARTVAATTLSPKCLRSREPRVRVPPGALPETRGGKPGNGKAEREAGPWISSRYRLRATWPSF